MTVPISSPHVHAPLSVQRMMLDVMLALLPATLFGVWLFGWPALNVLVLSIAAALASEALSLKIAGKAITRPLTDGLAALTGWLLALSLPPWAPWWIAVLGSAFAIFVGKHLFGGIGQNIFHPAMLARVALLISFPVELTFWVAPHPLNSSNTPGFMESLAITFQGVNSIPVAYIPDRDLRLHLYRRLADFRTEDELETLRAELTDRFGPVPEEIENLMYQMRVRMRAAQA